MPKDLMELVNRAAQALGKPKPAPTLVIEPQAKPALPLVNLLSNAIPAPTSFEEAMDQALALGPKARPGPDPRKPWIGKGTMELVPVLSLPDWEAVKLQEALRKAVAQAKLGRRLTLSQRRLLAKHKLDRAMSKLRKPLGE